MPSEPPQPSELNALRERCETALRVGGYWRARARLTREGALRMLRGRPLFSEWQLPRVPPEDDPTLYRQLVGSSHLAVVALEGSPPADGETLVELRIVPCFAEGWQAL